MQKSLPPSLPAPPVCMCVFVCDGVFVTLKRTVTHDIDISQHQMQLNLLNIKWGVQEFQVFFILYSKVTSFGKKALCFDINGSLRKQAKEKFIVAPWKHGSNIHLHQGRVNPVGLSRCI